MSGRALQLGLCVAALACVGACQRIPGASATAGNADDGNADDGDDDDSDDGGPGEGDGGPTDPPTYACDPQDPMACAHDQKCTPVLGSGGQRTNYICVDDVVSRDPFQDCTVDAVAGKDGCPPGYACLADENDLGLCLPLCRDQAGCSEALCEPNVTDGVKYCADVCDPSVSNCPTPLQCRRSSDRFVCRYYASRSNGVTGDECDTLTSYGCSEGFDCVLPQFVGTCAGVSCCTPFCTLALPDADALCQAQWPETSGMRCFPLGDALAPGYEQLGVCIVSSG